MPDERETMKGMNRVKWLSFIKTQRHKTMAFCNNAFAFLFIRFVRNEWRCRQTSSSIYSYHAIHEKISLICECTA